MASTSNPNPNPIPCSHLTTFKSTHTLKLFKPSKNQTSRCSSCLKIPARLYLCLICSQIHCLDHSTAHSQSHPGHEIAIDIGRSELYCFDCNDQIYDVDFEKKKRRKKSCFDKEMVRGVDQHCGLRGMNNLGNTCFMNSVLQALVHTPPLKTHFLGHREVCRQRRRRRRRRAAVGGGELGCLACDVDRVFSAAFSGDPTPFSPARFLYSWWQHSTELAGYEQQDAHEFFISVLDRIHEKEQPNHSNKAFTGIGDCHCIAHRVFSGILRSDITCTICGFTSTTYDPCVDISLNLEPTNGGTPTLKKSTKQTQNPNPSSLIRCLDLFTKPEKLGSDQKLYCQHCQIQQDSMKQMSIRRLPLVLCFHIKRYEHSVVKKTMKKIEQCLNFPLSLDMTPYLSSSIVRKRFGSRYFAFEGDELEVASELTSEFEVFAVVSHTGQMDSGHYVTFLRLRGDEWYKCDDAWITRVSDGVVWSSQGYLVYYVQKVLYFKSGTGVNCFPGSACC